MNAEGTKAGAAIGIVGDGNDMEAEDRASPPRFALRKIQRGVRVNDIQNTEG